MKCWDVRQTEAIQFSYSGNNESFANYKPSLESFLTSGGLLWQRSEKNCPYPLKISFNFTFIPFNTANVWKSGPPPSIQSIVFVHFYFLTVNSLSEYKQALPSLAEWFAAVKPSSWLLILDTSAIKENKVRTQLFEKVKSDIPDAQHRIVEIRGNTDTLGITQMNNGFLQQLTSILDQYVAGVQSTLLSHQDSVETNPEQLTGLINNQLKLCQLYWSLGIDENALCEIDSLESTISKLIYESIHGDNHSLFEFFKSRQFTDVPTLKSQLQVNAVEENDNLISIRAFILANQIDASLRVYRSRSRAGDEAAKINLNHFFVSLILKITIESLRRVSEIIGLLLIDNAQNVRCSVNIIWCSEVLRLIWSFGDIMGMETSAAVACEIYLLYTSALHQILDCESSKWEKLLGSTLTECYRDGLVKAMKLTSALGRHNSAFSVKWKYVEYLIAHKRNEEADEILKKILLSIKGCQVSSEVAKLFFKDSEKSLGFLSEQTRNVCQLTELLVNGNQTALSKLTESQRNMLVEEVEWNGGEMFPYEPISVSPCFVLMKATTPTSFTVKIYSEKAVQLSKCIFGCFLKKRNVEQINVKTDNYLGVHLRKLNNSTLLSFKTEKEESNSVICLCQNQPEELTVGPNILQFEVEATVTSAYSFDCLFCDYTLEDNAKIRIFMPNSKCQSEFGIAVKNPSVEIINRKKLYSGLPHSVNLNIRAGSVPLPSGALLKLKSLNRCGVLEFLDEKSGKWTKMMEMTVGEVSAEESQQVRIIVCFTPKVVKTSNFEYMFEETSVMGTTNLIFSVTISLKNEYVGVRGQVDFRLALLIFRMLFETYIQRCDDDDGTILLPEDIQIVYSCADEQEPPLPVLLSPEFKRVCLGSVYHLRWKVPNTGVELNGHQFTLKYRIDSKDNLLANIDPTASYVYEEFVNFSVPRVEYELSLRIVSNGKNPYICRINSPCELFVSIRSLTNQRRHIAVCIQSLDWKCPPKSKLAIVKENGLVEMSFAIEPKGICGYIAYPNVNVFKLKTEMDGEIGSDVPETALGDKITVFNRTDAKHIHITGNNSRLSSTASDLLLNDNKDIKRSFKTQAKQKLQKLFE